MKSILKITFFFLNLSVFSTSMMAQNPSSISGSITMTDETMAGLNAQFGQNLLKTGVVFEVWSVVYRDVMAKSKTGAVVSNTRVYLTQKQTGVTITPSIGVSGGSKSINFTVNNIPQQGSFVVLYYFNGYPPQFKLFKPSSKLDDGSNRTGLQYATNAAMKIGTDKKFGVLSINKTGQSHVYSVALLANTTGVVAYGLFGDIIDFFEDVADAVWEGGKTLAGVVVDAAGTIIVQGYGIVQALVTDDGVIIPRYREITTEEYNWANEKIFNNTLPEKSKIIITNLRGYGQREFVFPIGAAGGGKIMMNLGKVGYDNPKMLRLDKGYAQGQVFMHELTHVWQIHNRADISFVAHAIYDQCAEDKKALYQFVCGSAWNDYKIEQQATGVAKCFVNRENKIVSCEEPYIVQNIRKGVPFPIVRTPECGQLLSNIASVNKQIADRILALKAQYAEEHDISPVRNPDGTFKVGTEKGYANITLPPSVINNDATIKSLRAQLKTYTDKQTAINCH